MTVPLHGSTPRSAPADPLLTVAQAAVRLGTTVRFPRRLIEEGRIKFVRMGKHVRIAESVLNAYIKACTVDPIAPPIVPSRQVMR